MKKIFLFFLALSLWSCTKSVDECKNAPDVSDIKINIDIERLDRKMMSAKSEEELKSFLDAHPVFAQNVLQINEYPDEKVLIQNLNSLVNDPYLDTLYQYVQGEFGNLEPIEKKFEQAFRYGKYYFPEMKVPEIKTMFTALSHDMYMSSETIIIGLDYFAGKEAPYRPKIPAYILIRYTPEYIVPNTMLLWANRFNETQISDNTMLAEMIYYGKAYYFTKKMLPCEDNGHILGYTDSQMESIRENEETIWAHFIDNQLLYATNHFEITKYLSERPAVVEISSDCPGRIGRYLGWKIVKRYMDRNPEVTLAELMKESDAQKIFEGSKYRPGM